MKTELILVGKTNDKLYINGIKDYTERISHYMPFNITTIPALKNTKNLSEDQQKQAEGEQILRLIQPSDTVVLLDEHGTERTSMEIGAWLRRRADSPPTYLRHRRTVWFFRCRVQTFGRNDFTLTNDILSSNGATDIHRATISRLHYHKGRELPSRITRQQQTKEQEECA